MRIKFIISFTIFLTGLLFSQVLKTIPEFAKESDSIIVIFNAAEGNQGLKGYTGDVYAHTGVLTNLSATPSDWKHVIGSWGNNTTQPKLTRIGTDLYQLVIGNPREFYKVTETAENIQKLAFVFRSSDNQKTGRDSDGGDIFATIYEKGVNVSIVSPTEEFLFTELNDTISIKAIATDADTLSLFLDNIVLSRSTTDSLEYDLVVQTTGKHWIKVVGVNNNGTKASDSLSYIVNIEASVLPLPDGITTGINYISNNSVTLALYAPNKKFVYLIGDFTDWQIDTAFQMNRTPNNSTYWITVNNLSIGTEYGFQYLIDGDLKIPDPYADKILDPWNDKWIDDATYPNLKKYPTDKTTGIVSVLQTAQGNYVWTTDNFLKPKKTDLVIYEMLIRDFVSTHHYQTLIDTLDYLQKLGVNAIELMPVFEFEGNESWGYNPMMYFAPDKYYGTKNDLKAFIDAAHGKGIAVILDMVLNHSYGLNPLVRLYWDAANNRPSPDNPWFNVTSPNPVYSWGSDFNHESQATKDFVDRVNKYWLTEYKFDGFRFDFTKGFTNTPGDGGARDNARIQILKRMADAIWQTDPQAYVILEHFVDNSEEKELAEYGMLVWGNSNYNFNEATMGYNESGKSDFSWASYKNRGWSVPHLVSYMESHDEERLMYKNLLYGNSSGGYSVKYLPTALNRIKLASAFFFSIPGPKMIWQFGELGYDVSIEENGRVGNKPILWNYLDDINRENLYKTISVITDLKKNFDVFETTNFSMSVSSGAKRIALNHASMSVTIIGNFNVAETQINPAFQHSGKWYDFFSGDSVVINDASALISLAPGEFHIYSDKKLPTPEAGILTDIEEETISLPDQFLLAQNYPNPFNPETTIEFGLPNNSKVRLTIYNILGEEIVELFSGDLQSGYHKLNWNGRNKSGAIVPSGIYLYRISTPNFTEVKKCIMLK
ncbi:MAG: alpha-amylase family glycosyl hydrolase [Bacteroidota bacterium]